MGSGKVESPDGALSKAPSIHVGDEYVDQSLLRRKYNNESKVRFAICDCDC